MITLRFCSRWPYHIGSWLVARLGGSKMWSHCLIIIDDKAYEATMSDGCRIVPIDVAMQGVKYYQDMYIPIPDIDKAKCWGIDQKGKGYDFMGVLGIPFLMSEDWADWSKWWCSEFCFMQISAGGIDLLDKSVQKRVTPQDLYDCNYKKSEIFNLTK